MKRHPSLVLMLLFVFVTSLMPVNSQAAEQTPVYLPFVTNAARTSQAITSDGGTLRSPDGRMIVTVPAGAVSTPVTMQFAPVATPPSGTPATTMALAFELNAIDESGQFVHQFAHPLTVQVQLPAGTTQGVLNYYDPAQDRWMALPSTVDTQGLLTATTTHFTLFGVPAGIGDPTITSISPDPGNGTIGQPLTITVSGGFSGPGSLLVYIRNKKAGSKYGPYITTACVNELGGGPRSIPFSKQLIVPSPLQDFPYAVGVYFHPSTAAGSCPNYLSSVEGEVIVERDYTINWFASPSNPTTEPVPTPTPTIAVQGRAIAANGEPLINAKVQLRRNDQEVGTTTTGANGNFAFASQQAEPSQHWDVRVLLEDAQRTFWIVDAATGGTSIVTLQYPLSIGQNTITLKAGESNVSWVNTASREHLANLSNMYTYIVKEQQWSTATFALQSTPAPSTFSSYDPSEPNNAAYRSDSRDFAFGSAYTDEQQVSGVSVVEDTVYHEMGHRLHDQLIGYPIRPPADIPPAIQIGCDAPTHRGDHCGSANTSSAWGYIEGFANWMSITQRNNPIITYVDDPNTSVYLESNYRWNGTAPMSDDYAEEYAIAGILWDLIDPVDASDDDFVQVTPLQVWTALLQADKAKGMLGVYDALRNASIGQGDQNKNHRSDLDDIFIAHNFFHDDNGNGRYDASEQVGPSWDPAHSHRINKGPSPAQYGVRVVTTGGYPDHYRIHVQFQDHPAWSYDYTMPASDAPDGLVRLYPPDTQYDVEVAIRAQTANGLTNPVLIEGPGFWGAVEEHASEPFLAQVTLTVGATTPVKFDDTPPVTMATQRCTLPGNNGWCRGSVAVTLSATDDRSGVARREYQLDAGDWVQLPGATSTITFTDEGPHTLHYRAVDKSKNVEQAKEISFKIDTRPPVTSNIVPSLGEHSRVAYTIADPMPGSGGYGLRYQATCADGTPRTGWLPGEQGNIILDCLMSTVIFWSEDNAGNVEAQRILKVSWLHPELAELSDYQALGDTLGSRDQYSPLKWLIDVSLNSYWRWRGFPKAVAVQITRADMLTMGAIKASSFELGRNPNTYVQYSDDGIIWHDISNLTHIDTGVSRAPTPFYADQAVTAKYFRVVLDNTDYWDEIGFSSDLQLAVITLDAHALDPVANPAPVLASHRLPVPSCTASAGDCTAALDGQPTKTRWLVEGTPMNATITLDLGQARQVTGLRFYDTYTLPALHTTVALSPDGVNWTTLPNATDINTGQLNVGGHYTAPPAYGVNELGPFAPQTARYIRFRLDNPEQLWSIGGYGEIDVLGY